MTTNAEEMTEERFRRIGEDLLGWYADQRRDLPWRRRRDPYSVWVSEVMLQQTQVRTVQPYYERFMASFPTLEALAAASLDEVLKAWENLGYYARARHLHQAARQIVTEHAGRFPETWAEIRNLPGVGEYIAGAVLSIAFGHRVPAVDGNVRRVVSRLFAIDGPLQERRVQKQLAEIVQRLIPEEGPGEFNQGMMDLGATICTPRNPLCGACPVRRSCRAFDLNLQNELPKTAKRPAVPHRRMAAGVIRDDLGRVLLVRRPEEGLLGGLWSWPGVEVAEGRSLKAALRRMVSDDLGVRVRVGDSLGVVVHQYSHFRAVLHVYSVECLEAPPSELSNPAMQWFDPADLGDLALSKADRNILELVSSEFHPSVGPDSR